MSFIKYRSSLIVSTIVIACVSVSLDSAYAADKAESEASVHGSEYISEDALKIPQIPWDIIGTHTARELGSEKFINPAQGCARAKEKDDDYLLQLELCKEERKGWLKI